MNNQTKPDSAAPGGDVEQSLEVWLLYILGEWDFTMPKGAFDAIIAALSAPRRVGVTDGWVSVNDRLPEEALLVAVYTPDKGDGAGVNFDFRYEGGWHDHDNSFEHYMAVGGSGAAGPDCVCIGPSEQAPYTHWRDIGTPFSSPQPAPQPAEAEGRDWTPVDIQTFARAYKQEVPNAKLTVHGISAGLNALTPPEQPAIDLEQLKEAIAIELWHRFAPEHEMEWEDETHKAEYLNVAAAILAIIDGAKGDKT